MSSEVITRNDLKNVINSLLPIFYPVGSYYETSDSTFNPNTEWGGTWELELAGQVHVSSGTGYAISGAESNTSDGGSKDAVVVSHNHTQNQHRHDSGASSAAYYLMTSAQATNSGQFATGSSGRYAFYGTAGGLFSRVQNTDYTTPTNNSTGVDGTNKNMPPYIVVNRWHRVG